ncbi:MULTISPECIES: chemotaxis response regulator protein-glutamate methylesterase [unclassified Paenibacillus]|uniref:protein-glutamate methylesterase/protein-glutamine glutaminase n=1 Tax=unclassified Paenibacillus TaxID=185978 RepID=UPI000FE21177|nr:MULTISPECIES: chemotaxis response regulator protein-glutamate methylesterase [unclassified Paenibacillus]MCM3175311.1 chemotaxis response regulator protein-glutamate methylesterase [Paenibacillus sp. MER 99-2]
MAVYQVLVVDDSAFMRKIVSDLIEADSEFKVAATAANGKEAIQKALDVKPDIITMDVEMPEMNGLDALQGIMKQSYVPVIMLSGINEQGMKETIMALEAGAFDFIRKPSISHDQDIAQVGKALVERMRAAMNEVERKANREASLQKKEEAQGNLMNQSQRIQRDVAAVPSRRELDQKKIEPAKLEKRASSEQTPSVQSKVVPKNTPPLLNQKPARVDQKTEVSKSSDRKLEPKEIKELRPSKPAAPPKEIRSARIQRVAADQVAATSASGNTPESRVAPTQRGVSSLEVGFNKLVAIGCSTGGPRALKTLLEQLPADLPAPVVIVQHMPPNFTRSLAQRLNTFSPLHVVEAEEGMILKKGTAYIAPGGYHIKVNRTSDGKFILKLTEEHPVNGHRPSVDTMFESLLPHTSLQRHLVLLTGMGSDGARMMKKLYESGVTSTFAENEETCVVYGMPRSAVELQCVRHLLPLQEIAPKLVQAVK